MRLPSRWSLCLSLALCVDHHKDGYSQVLSLPQIYVWHLNLYNGKRESDRSWIGHEIFLLQLLLWVCADNIVSQDHASPRKGEDAQLCPLWQIICKRLSFDDAQKIPLWRETFQVQTLQQVLHRIWRSKKTPANTLWSKAIQVRTVQQVLHPTWTSQDTSAYTHWGKAIQV